MINMTRAFGRLQKLLFTEEYDDFEDKILVEGQFVELDKCGDPLRPVILGLTQNCLIIATEEVPDLRASRASVLVTDGDPEIDELELHWVVPLFFIKITVVPQEHILNVESRVGRHRYFLMSVTRGMGEEKTNWLNWMKKIEYMNEDPYGYLKDLFARWNLIFDGNIYGTIDNENQEKRIDNMKTMLNKAYSKEKMKAITDIRDSKKRAEKLEVKMDLYDTSDMAATKNNDCFHCWPRTRISKLFRKSKRRRRTSLK